MLPQTTGVLNNTGHNVVFSLDGSTGDLTTGDNNKEADHIFTTEDIDRNLLEETRNLVSSNTLEEMTGMTQLEDVTNKIVFDVPINITGGPLSYRYQVSAYEIQ